MKTIRHTSRLVSGLALGLAVAVAAVTAAAAAVGKPAGMSAAEYRALMIRSQALNVLYQASAAAGPAAATQRADLLRGQELNRLYGNAYTRMTPSEFRAAYARGTWLNENARTIWPATPTASAPRVVTVGDGFDWTDAAIGGGFVGGLAVLGAAGALAARRHGRLIHLPH